MSRVEPAEAPAPSWSRFRTFDRSSWAALRASTPLTLSATEVEGLQATNEAVSLGEVTDIYLPLSRLLSLYVDAASRLYRASNTFLGRPELKVPYVIGVAGSVAVGKSTTARLLQTLLARWPAHPRVDLVTTDGFLFPNRVFEDRQMMDRKGFPESYDQRRLLDFMIDLKSGVRSVAAPVYSHHSYDIVPGACQVVEHPDIVIVEGLNVLQAGSDEQRPSRQVVSDFFDFSIYVDAAEDDIEDWYVLRFLRLCETAFRDPDAFFHQFAALSHTEAVSAARHIWGTINAVNLRENILPTRERAHLVLEKGTNHAVHQIRLRKL